MLFLDEPSALLDPEGREQIWSAVKAVSDGRTLIIVEHRIEEMARYVDRVVLFSPDGVILGEGPPAAIFAEYERELKLMESGIPAYGKIMRRPGRAESYLLRSMRLAMSRVIVISCMRSLRRTLNVGSLSFNWRISGE